MLPRCANPCGAVPRRARARHPRGLFRSTSLQNTNSIPIEIETSSYPPSAATRHTAAVGTDNWTELVLCLGNVGGDDFDEGGTPARENFGSGSHRRLQG